MIKCERITYKYGNQTVLSDFSLVENEPTITALWGRNGAGKTTMMKLLAGHFKPNEGIISVLGEQPFNNTRLGEKICFMEEEHPFSIIWNVQDALRFGSYFNKNWDDTLAYELVETFQLDLKKNIKKLSKGMRSALQFIIGISSHAEVTILDEPTNGLDAAMRKKMYRVLLESYEAHPRLILLSTHHIDEIQSICERLIVIQNQQIALQEEMDEVRELGFWLTGEIEKVEGLVANETVLTKEYMGNQLKVLVDAPFNSDWRNTAEQHRVSIASCDIQDYLLYKTEEGVMP
ncbi:ABC transporter ATP-binding protein [Halalkalibacillus halophilus]|uniref:ATP-binding cassette domain-containing protein n=1 Tax=Halalkalibacillus halophilus TaxID=392827 RepID=UPI0003FBAF31|nr:ABC transporter ATP-binding protein [Halalkalibacillus halophilus]